MQGRGSGGASLDPAEWEHCVLPSEYLQTPALVMGNLYYVVSGRDLSLIYV